LGTKVVASLLLIVLEGGVQNVAVLARHLVVSEIDAWLTGLLNGRVLKLLAITIQLGIERGWWEWLRCSHAIAQVHSSELLSSQVKKLLLQLLLPLSEV
jgi:hypothetical protein